ncbi:GNAT family N-acetyltransferase [Novosphingobium sediminicola]|uniref:Putative acetyltransferase n=1 Tax=Novosphingobium sediminicola TaxID=563162 RepID=A0A7W6CED6_9SPHN|nr:GNAT family N-acetyltransferase [Novosphingobium sediminicola]MBB3954287.1 putative acetyltransferase [Novosphingobium sediminicola]
MNIREDNLSGPEIARLLTWHLDQMQRWSPADKVHAMPIERLRASDVTFYSAWVDGELAGCGAIRHLDATRGELKSMRVAPDYLGRGIGRAILHHLIEVARGRGYRQVLLETGKPDAFIPARRLYESEGFSECPAFAGYTTDDYSLCMSRDL